MQTATAYATDAEYYLEDAAHRAQTMLNPLNMAHLSKNLHGISCYVGQQVLTTEEQLGCNLATD